MKDDMIYRSIFKGKADLKENRQKQLKSIVESLRVLKGKLREEDGDLLDVSTDVDTATPEAIADIIGKVEDLVVDAITTLGATDEVTSELIGTAGSLESMKDEEEMIAAIDASAEEADDIQEGFDPMYDSMGGYLEDEYEDEMLIDEPMMMDYDDDYVYESKRKPTKVRKFNKNKF